MSSSADLLVDAFTRVRDLATGVVDGLTPEQLTHRVDGRANSVAWLVWHLARVQDDHVADVAGTPQVWPDGWADRFALPFDVSATGYGQTSADVDAVAVSADLLAGYVAAVTEATLAYVRTLTDDDLDRVVDDAWDPPVTLAVRLLSVVSDDLQHVGQAALVRGVLPD